jgi:predicted MFS family arabinose efflux permease
MQDFLLWRNRDFLLLWSGQIISSIGTEISQFAFPLLVLALTHSPALAGLIVSLRLLPYFIFSLPAGALIDRWNRKHVMILCECMRMLNLASIPLAYTIGILTLIQLALVSFIEGTFYVFFNIAEAACLPNVVSKEQLPKATAQYFTIFSFASLLGSPLGGTLYSIGRIFPFLLDIVSYLFSALSLLFIKTPLHPERAGASEPLWVEIKDGLLWLWRRPLLRTIAALTFGFNLSTVGVTLLVIVLAQHLHASPFTLGIIFTCGGVGSLLGAVVTPFIQKRLSFKRAIISFLGIYVVLWLLYILAINLFLLAAITALFFAGVTIYNNIQFSYRSMLIPDTMQGRANSVFRLIAFTGAPLGTALTGVLLQALGIVPTLLTFSACFLVLAIGAWVNTHFHTPAPTNTCDSDQLL